MDLSIYCPRCGNEILKSASDRLKLRTKVLIQDPGGAVRGVCRNCGEEMPLPLALSLSALKDARLYVR